jgi:cytochrome P450
VRSVFKDVDIEEVRSGSNLNSCRHLSTFIDEAMRMTPPVPRILQCTVLSGSIEIDGNSVREGFEVTVAHFALHHNPSYFPDSFEYHPERFFNEREDNELKAFARFSVGLRACIGKNMAYMETMITMARVLLLFDIRGWGF